MGIRDILCVRDMLYYFQIHLHHLLVSWRILIWNLETREEEIRKAEAEAAFERKRNCIQPSKPTDRLYKSQAADGLAFLHYFA